MQPLFDGPAYRIRTNRLILKCWDPIYAERLEIAIRDSRDSLLPWLRWAKYKSSDIKERANSLRKFRSSFDLDENYIYGIFDLTEEKVLGGCGLHKRVGPLGFDIGYLINKRFQNKGYATETAAALIRAGFDLFYIDRIEIHCDEENIKSRRVINKLGIIHECTLPRRQIDANGRYQNLLQFVMFRKEYEQSEIRNTNAVFYSATNDEMGKKV